MLGSINSKAGKVLNVVLIVLFTLLVVDVFWGVLTRYVLGGQARWSEELARLLMVWLALLGAALASREEKHLGLDVLVRQWPADLQQWARVFIHLCVGLFSLFILTWGGGQMVLQRFSAGQMLPSLGISKAWFYMALPVSGILMVLFSLELLAASFKALKEGGEQE